MTSTGASSSLQQGPDPAVTQAINRGNAVVFLDMVLGGGTEDKSGGSPLGRIKLELFVKDVSMIMKLLSLCGTICIPPHVVLILQRHRLSSPTQCPKTCENFRQFCTGEFTSSQFNQQPTGYKGSTFHRIIKDFVSRAWFMFAALQFSSSRFGLVCFF